jgi:hypothetical protein
MFLILLLGSCCRNGGCSTALESRCPYNSFLVNDFHCTGQCGVCLSGSSCHDNIAQPRCGGGSNTFVNDETCSTLVTGK